MPGLLDIDALRPGAQIAIGPGYQVPFTKRIRNAANFSATTACERACLAPISCYTKP